MKEKKKSPIQNRFESSRKDYNERQVLMEMLYNVRLTRDMTLKIQKTMRLMSIIVAFGGAVYLIKTCLSFFKYL